MGAVDFLGTSTQLHDGGLLPAKLRGGEFFRTVSENTGKNVFSELAKKKRILPDFGGYRVVGKCCKWVKIREYERIF